MKIQDVFEFAFQNATQLIDPELLVLDADEIPTKLVNKYKVRLVDRRPVMESFIIEGRRGLILPDIYHGRIILIERIPGNPNSVVAYMRTVFSDALTKGYDMRQIIRVPLIVANRKASSVQNKNIGRVMTALRQYTYPR